MPSRKSSTWRTCSAPRTLEGEQALGAWLWLIASYMELGRESEARVEAEKYLEHNTDFSVKGHAEWLRAIVYKNPSWQDRFIESLRKAGFPK